MTSKHDVEVGVEDVELWLGDLKDQFNIYAKNGKVIAKPKQYLGNETFAKAAAIVREHGGEYISAGKESRFQFVSIHKQTQKAERGNNGTTSIFYCPYCGRRCQQVITKEAS